MQQSLAFYDAILAHDHPAYMSILRFSLVGAKRGTDMSLVKLAIVTLTFLPLNVYTSLFGTNSRVPNQRPDLEPGEPWPSDDPGSSLRWFGLIAMGAVFIACAVWFIVWLVFRSSRKAVKRRGPALMR